MTLLSGERLSENHLEPSLGEVISPIASSLNAIHIDFSRTLSKRSNVYIVWFLTKMQYALISLDPPLGGVIFT